MSVEDSCVPSCGTVCGAANNGCQGPCNCKAPDGCIQTFGQCAVLPNAYVPNATFDCRAINMTGGLPLYVTQYGPDLRVVQGQFQFPVGGTYPQNTSWTLPDAWTSTWDPTKGTSIVSCWMTTNAGQLYQLYLSTNSTTPGYPGAVIVTSNVADALEIVYVPIPNGYLNMSSAFPSGNAAPYNLLEISPMPVNYSTPSSTYELTWQPSGAAQAANINYLFGGCTENAQCGSNYPVCSGSNVCIMPESYTMVFNWSLGPITVQNDNMILSVGIPSTGSAQVPSAPPNTNWTITQAGYGSDTIPAVPIGWGLFDVGNSTNSQCLIGQYDCVPNNGISHVLYLTFEYATITNYTTDFAFITSQVDGVPVGQNITQYVQVPGLLANTIQSQVTSAPSSQMCFSVAFPGGSCAVPGSTIMNEGSTGLFSHLLGFFLTGSNPDGSASGVALQDVTVKITAASNGYVYQCWLPSTNETQPRLTTEQELVASMSNVHKFKPIPPVAYVTPPSKSDIRPSSELAAVPTTAASTPAHFAHRRFQPPQKAARPLPVWALVVIVLGIVILIIIVVLVSIMFDRARAAGRV